MIRAAALLTTLALAATACTFYIDTDDDDHGPWQPSPDAAGPSTDAQWQGVDARPYCPDAGAPLPDAPLPDAGPNP